MRDPATGRLCAIADDSRACLIGRCLRLGCFPTLREVLDAILDFLKSVLKVIGIVLLLILLALIGRWLLRPGPSPVPVPGMAPPVVASRETPEGEGEASEPSAAAEEA